MSIIKIAVYTMASGKAPFIEWLDDLDDTTQGIILARIDRVTLGNFGDYKVLKGADAISEFRINYGPGYRIYFGNEGLALVILLMGGGKGSQDRDIAKAKRYWREYKELKQKRLL